MTNPEETTRPCRWCRGLGSRTDARHAPQRWTCEDCGGTGREEWCPVCREWVGPGHVCEEDDRVTDGGNAALSGGDSRTLEGHCSANPLDKEDGYATGEVIEWAAWIDHTEGTEVCADERSICIAHAILEAVEQYEQNSVICSTQGGTQPVLGGGPIQ